MAGGDNDRDDDAEQAAELRSFGRRRGRKLSARQDELLATMLPRLTLDLRAPAPAELSELFAPLCVTDIWLEIGFGGGEHLVWQAARNPGVGMIGCEPFADGVVKVLTQVADMALANIRLHADDARDVLRWLPAASIARAFVLFPDPWPKRKHQKRRLLNAGLLDLLAGALRPGAELRIATDIADYVRTIMMAFQNEPRFTWQAARPDDWRVRPADWPQTRYEQKAVREGRGSVYLRFKRV